MYIIRRDRLSSCRCGCSPHTVGYSRYPSFPFVFTSTPRSLIITHENTGLKHATYIKYHTKWCSSTSKLHNAKINVANIVPLNRRPRPQCTFSISKWTPTGTLKDPGYPTWSLARSGRVSGQRWSDFYEFSGGGLGSIHLECAEPHKYTVFSISSRLFWRAGLIHSGLWPANVGLPRIVVNLGLWVHVGESWCP